VSGEAAAVSPPLLALEGVAKVYPRGEAEITALDGVSIEVRQGESLAVMGPSGS
jgi:putative ABC transport system ATP-binding protein